MEFSTWFKTWLSRHPLKAPSEADRAAYTAQVMMRVRGEAPAPAYARAVSQRPAWSWPRLTLAFATATAVAVALVTLNVQRVSGPRTLATERAHSELLVAFDDANPVGLEEDLELLAEEWRELNGAMFAETPPTDAEWLEALSQVLEEVDDQAPPDGDLSDEEWLRTLEHLEGSASETSS